MERSSWTLRDAIVWARSGRKEDVANPSITPPDLLAAQLYQDSKYAKLSDGDEWLAAALLILKALASGALTARRIDPEGLAAPIDSGFWHNKSVSWLSGAGGEILLSAGEVQQAIVVPRAFGTVAQTLTNSQIDDWIKQTHFTSKNEARNAFMKDPRAVGLSAAFEERWRALRPRRPGRPRKGA